jgi:hypothetical protein
LHPRPAARLHREPDRTRPACAAWRYASAVTRHLFPINRDWVLRRAAILREQEDAAIRAARDEAKTDDERAFMDALLQERARNSALQR